MKHLLLTILLAFLSIGAACDRSDGSMQGRQRSEQVRALVIQRLGGDAGLNDLGSTESVVARRVQFKGSEMTRGEPVALTSEQTSVLLTVLRDVETYSAYLPGNPQPSCSEAGNVCFTLTTANGTRECFVEFSCHHIAFDQNEGLLYRQAVKASLFGLVRELFPNDVELDRIAAW